MNFEIKLIESDLEKYLKLSPEFSEKVASKTIAIGAASNGEPIGLLLANLTAMSAEISYIFVKEQFRNKNVASNLLQFLDKKLEQDKFAITFASYESSISSKPILEHIFLEKLKWHGPRLHYIKCKFDSFAFDPPWLHLEYPLPIGFEIFSWSELLQEEKDKLRHANEKGLIPDFISPFNEEEKIEPLNSLGIRYKGAVIGWMITHRVSPDTILYASFFIKKEWQHGGVAVRLLCDAIKLQKQTKIAWALLEANILKTEPSWIKFIERRLVPYSHEVTYLKQVWKAPQK